MEFCNNSVLLSDIKVHTWFTHYDYGLSCKLTDGTTHANILHYDIINEVWVVSNVEKNTRVKLVHEMLIKVVTDE